MTSVTLMTKVVQVELSEEAHRRLKSRAAQEGVNLKDLLRRILEGEE